MKETIIGLLNDYPDKKIVAEHIIQFIRGLSMSEKEIKEVLDKEHWHIINFKLARAIYEAQLKKLEE